MEIGFSWHEGKWLHLINDTLSAPCYADSTFLVSRFFGNPTWDEVVKQEQGQMQQQNKEQGEGKHQRGMVGRQNHLL